uniref:Type 2 lantibiotic biosynthesis protein LanM n=1 Tax=Eubacterium plexicaudatum ASF492 TaxID=1235802 RepID=N2A3B7_9FIRM
MENIRNANFFTDFYKKYMDIFDSKLKESSERMGMALAFPAVRKHIYEEFLGISKMVLIYELHCYREAGLLIGDSSEERFESYNEIVGTEEFHHYIEKNYPVLEYLFQRKMEHAVKCVESISEAFINDKEELSNVFGKKFGKIDDMEIGNGDTHQLGKTVAILTGDFGKVVYKSRDFYNDSALNDIVEFLNRYSIRCKLKKNRVLGKKGYGWQEFIEKKECMNDEEVARFYYREGIYLAIFYIFNSGDMHYENIIADGEYPRMIDTETLVTLSGYKNISLKENVHNFARDNVLSTSFLPIKNKRNVMDVDLCGLSGGNLKSQKMKEYDIENYGTDQMKLVRKYICQQMEQTNIPKMNGEQVNILAWREQLIEGFEDAMNIFYKNKEQLSECIAKSDIKYSHQRQLFRNTYSYAKFLQTGCYPTYLTSLEQRKKLFEKMRNSGNIKNQRVEHEISLLMEGCIPAYYSMFEERTLYSNGKVIQTEFFNQSGNETVTYKISSLSPETIRLQKHIINLSYMTLIKDIIKKPADIGNSAEYYENFMQGAKSIFDNISKNILIDPDSEKQDLYIIRLGDHCQSLQGLDMSLYEGGGLIWSMYCYARETENNQLMKQCLALLESAEDKQDKMAVLESTSVYAGIGSAVYILFNIYMDTGDPKYYKLCEKYLRKISERLDTIESIDYMHGISGYVVLLSKMLEKEKHDYLLRIFEKSCEILCNLMKCYRTETAGIAHGSSGVALALSFLVKHTCDRSYLKSIEKILCDEKNYVEKDNMFWCRGTAGSALAKAQILKNLKDMCNDSIYLNIKKEFDKEIGLLLEYRSGENDNLCLCHGLYGYYDVMNSIICNEKEILTEHISKALIRKMEVVKDRLIKITEKRLWLTSDYMLETFMLGSSGPAYAMLRMHHNKYPSILSLDII